ncbi:MAG: hypothetical protein NE330_00870 [Lentisphaeraceae bacterium]|nr:hypothetical protein [Lentisphaeraceae bacterium]
MEIGGVSSPGAVRFSQLSHNEQVDLRINQIFAREDRTTRREVLQANLAFKNSLSTLKKLVDRGESQSDKVGDAFTDSNSSMSLSDTDRNTAIKDVPELENISDGYFLLNGIKIDVDTTNDTYNDVIQRINDSSANITATFNSGKLELASTVDFAMSNGSSNFFAESNLTTGTISSGKEEAHANFYKNQKFKEALTQFAFNLNKVFKAIDGIEVPELKEENEEYLEKIKEAVSTAVTNTVDSDFESESFVRFGFGVEFSYNGEDFMNFSVKEFDKNIVESYSDMEEFFNTFSDDGTQGGLLEQLDQVFNEVNSEIEEKIDSFSKIGLLVNTVA